MSPKLKLQKLPHNFKKKKYKHIHLVQRLPYPHLSPYTGHLKDPSLKMNDTQNVKPEHSLEGLKSVPFGP